MRNHVTAVEVLEGMILLSMSPRLSEDLFSVVHRL